MKKSYKTFLLRVLIGLITFLLTTIFHYISSVELRFLSFLNNHIFFEFNILLLLIFLLLQFYSKNENVIFFAESSMFFFLILAFISSFASILLLDTKIEKLIFPFIVYLSFFALWLLSKKAEIQVLKFIFSVITVFSVLVVADLINMKLMLISLKKIESKYYDDLDKVETKTLHYSIYSEVDTFNTSAWAREMKSDFLLPIVPLYAQDSVKKYDFCEIQKKFYLKPYFVISSNKIRKDISQFNILTKFYEEYYMTQYSNRVSYLKNKKTGEVIELKALLENLK